MSWTTPKTWTDTSDRLNAANLNQYIRDNQLALRAEAAALEQRIANLEVAGFSGVMERAISISTGSNGQAKLTNLAPPSNTIFIYFEVRVDRDDAWSACPHLEYSEWNGFSEVAGNALVPSGNRMSFVATSKDNDDEIQGFVCKGTGGVLAFGLSDNSDSDRKRFDRVRVKWYR